MPNPQVSVLVPVYGTAKQLPRCLDSILESIRNIPSEIILVDDCSPDDASEIIRSYTAKYPNLTLVQHQENMGLPYARQTAVDRAKGDYILHVDSDDAMLGGVLEEMLSSAFRYDADIVQAEMRHAVEATEGAPISELELGKVTEISGGLLRGDEIPLSLGNYWSKKYLQYRIWGKLLRRKLWDDVQPLLSDHNSLGEDVVFNVQLTTAASCAVLVDRVGFLYIRREGSYMTESWGLPQLVNLFDNGAFFLKHLTRIGRVDLIPMLDTYVRDILTDVTIARIRSSAPHNLRPNVVGYLQSLARYSALFTPKARDRALGKMKAIIEGKQLRVATTPLIAALQRIPPRACEENSH